MIEKLKCFCLLWFREAKKWICFRYACWCCGWQKVKSKFIRTLQKPLRDNFGHWNCLLNSLLHQCGIRGYCGKEDKYHFVCSLILWEVRTIVIFSFTMVATAALCFFLLSFRFDAELKPRLPQASTSPNY
jgi:hypothetical protein